MSEPLLLPVLPSTSSTWRSDTLQSAAGNAQQGTFRSWCSRKVAVLREVWSYLFSCFYRNDSEISGELALYAPEDRPSLRAPADRLPVPLSSGVNPYDPGYCSAWCASVREGKGASLKNRKCVYLASCAEPGNIEGAMKFVSEQARKMGITAKFVELPYTELDKYEVKKHIDGPLILCHSIKNGRSAVTNVLNALYGEFLEKARKVFGRYNVAVVLYDFPRERIESRVRHKDEMGYMWCQQYDMFNCSNLVLITDKLEDYGSLSEDFKHSVGQFIDMMRERALIG